MNEVTREEIVTLWRESMADRSVSEEFHRQNYEARIGFYESAPTFDQYQAMSAYLDAMGLEMRGYRDRDEARAARAETFGTLFPEAGPEDLERHIAAHADAMAAAYQEELDNALGGMTL